jgi:hypothetical protein
LIVPVVNVQVVLMDDQSDVSVEVKAKAKAKVKAKMCQYPTRKKRTGFVSGGLCILARQ